MLSDDDAPPCDRPNLSKDYLAGNAPEKWIPLRPLEFYREQGIHRCGGNPPSAIPNGLPEADQKQADDIRQGL